MTNSFRRKQSTSKVPLTERERAEIPAQKAELEKMRRYLTVRRHFVPPRHVETWFVELWVEQLYGLVTALPTGLSIYRENY